MIFLPPNEEYNQILHFTMLICILNLYQNKVSTIFNVKSVVELLETIIGIPIYFFNCNNNANN